MGAWGPEAWENDTAADWLGDLWDRAPLVDPVLEGLRSEDGDEVQVALWLCAELCRVYVWPIGRYRETLEVAVAAADRLLAGDDEDAVVDSWDDAGVPEVRQRVEAARAVLSERLATA